MVFWTFGIFIFCSLQFMQSYANPISPYSNIDPHSLNKFPSIKGTQTSPPTNPLSSAPTKHNFIEVADVYSSGGHHWPHIRKSYTSEETHGKTYPNIALNTHYEKLTPTMVPKVTVSGLHGNLLHNSVSKTEPHFGQKDFSVKPDFLGDGKDIVAESDEIFTTASSDEIEVVTKPNFIIQPVVETIERPEFVVHENVLGVISKPEFVVEEVPQIVSKPEFVVQEEVVGTVLKPTFVVEEQVSLVQKPEFAIQEDVEVIVKPDFKIQELTEVIPKPTFVVEENVIPVQKPTFAIQSSQEIVQKPDIIIAVTPVTVTKPEYQIAENIISVTKPSFLVQETQETVIKPEFVVTEEIVAVPKPNYLIQEQVQVVERPSFTVQDVVETVQKPEYSVQKSTVLVSKPEFFVEEVTETVVKPTFVEQESEETIISPQYLVQNKVFPVTKPQYVVEEEVVPVIKPEFFVEEVTEVVNRPEYVVEDVAVAVDKPTYVVVDTTFVVPKPNYVIKETVETITKPEYNIEEKVEVIKKPEFVIQEKVVATIKKPKFIVISSSHPNGEEFTGKSHSLSAGSPLPAAKQNIFQEDIPLAVFPMGNTYKMPAAEPVIIPPSLYPTEIDGVEEFMQPEPFHQNPFNLQPVPLAAYSPSLKKIFYSSYDESAPEVFPQKPHSRPVCFPHILSFSEFMSQLTPPEPLLFPEFSEYSIDPSDQTVSTLEVEEDDPQPKTLKRNVENMPLSEDHSSEFLDTTDITLDLENQPTPAGSEGTPEIHGLQILGKPLGYTVNVEPNDFNAPTLNVKRNSDQSEEERMFDTLYGKRDVCKHGVYYILSGIPHPKFGILTTGPEYDPAEEEDCEGDECDDLCDEDDDTYNFTP